MFRRAISVLGGVVLLGALTTGCAKRPAMSGETSAPAPATAATDGGYGLRAATVDYLTASAGAPMGLPANAKPGDCFAQAVVPAQYETVTERVVKRAAAARIEVVPPEYQETEARMLVKPATKRLETVPATFEEIEERVLVRQETTRLESVPATYRKESERVLVRAAYSMWKRSSELTAAERSQQKIDPAAGDILCLVEIPAEYKDVTREVLETPAATREVTVPAEFVMVKKTVMKTPETTREVEVPAEYRTVKINKVVAPGREVKTEVPAEYEEVSKQTVKVPASTEWRQVLCDTNASQQTLAALQQSLRRAGFDPGRDDGRVDGRTMNAVRSFQQAKGLPVDNDRYINIATVNALGVTP